MTIRSSKRVLITSVMRWPFGGIETHIVNLCRVLVDNGAEVTYVSRQAEPKVPMMQSLREIRVRVITTPFGYRAGRASTIWAMLAWPRHLWRCFDVLFTLDLSRFVTFLALFVKPGGCILGNRWGLPQEAAYPHPRTRRLLNGFIAETPVQAEHFRQLYGLTVPVAAIPYLANVSDTPPRQDRKIDELRIAFIGRLEAEKGVFRLLEIWPNLEIQPARLDYFGVGEREALERKIRERGLGDNVRVNGSYFTAEERKKVFENTDLIVFPSEGRHNEGLPLVLLEATAYGVPFVATDVGAVRTLAEENPDVCVVPLDNRMLKDGIEKMSRNIRSGAVDGKRLQRYHHGRYSYEHVSQLWLRALLQPEAFWSQNSLADLEAVVDGSHQCR